ncbi:MAG: hypothetical protein ACKVHR_15705 [Pirellulales bacterium]
MFWVQDGGTANCEIPQSVSPFAKIHAALAAGFTLLNICLVLYNLSEGVRRGFLGARESQLNLEKTGLFSSNQQSWQAGAVESVKVNIKKHESVGQDGGVSYSFQLEVRSPLGQ